MDYQEREFFVYRILSGYIRLLLDGRELKIIPPTDSVMYNACSFYKEVYQTAKSTGVMTAQEMSEFLEYENLWIPEQESELEALIKSVEDIKVKIYNSIFSSNDVIRYKFHLKEVEKKINDLTLIKRVFDIYTCEGLAEYSKSQYIIQNTARINGAACNWDEISLPKVFFLLQSNTIPDKVIRYISHNDPWNIIWNTNKKTGKLFKNKYISDDQKRIVSWSNMYDNIYKSPDCPHESVINDDDMLDGWLILQRREREGKQNQKRLDSKLSGKIASSDEVFIVAQTQEDIKNIYSLNDGHAKKVIENRKRKIKSSNRDIDFREFDDVKLKIITELGNKGK